MAWLNEPASGPVLLVVLLLLTIFGACPLGWAYRTRRLNDKAFAFLVGTYWLAYLIVAIGVQEAWTPVSYAARLLVVWCFCWLPGGALGVVVGAILRAATSYLGIKIGRSANTRLLGCGEHGFDEEKTDAALADGSVRPVRDCSKPILTAMCVIGCTPWVALLVFRLGLCGFWK